MYALFFDLDGTLVDSSKGIINSFIHSFEKMNLDTPDNKTLTTFIGPPLEVTFANFFSSQEEISKAILHFRNYYESKGVNQFTKYPDIVNQLFNLKQKGFKLFVTTSKEEKMAKKLIQDAGLTKYFTGIYGALPKSFHKTDVLQRALFLNEPQKEHSVIIGDTIYDMKAGKNLGILSMAVTWGFGLEFELKEIKPTYLVHTPQEMTKQLSQLFLNE